MSETLDTFHQVIEVMENCRIEVSMRDTLRDTGWFGSGVDAPITCDGRTIGCFAWDQVAAPKVLDNSGNQVVARSTTRRSFAEDGLGLRTALVGVDSSSIADTALVRVALTWRFLSWDTLAVPDSASLERNGLSASLLAISASSPDTAVFRLPRSEAGAEADSFSVRLLFRRGLGWSLDPSFRLR